MPRTLLDDLRQRKPFSSLQQEASLSVVRTSTMLQDASEELFKPHGITATQYNVLRILRGAEPEGLCRNELRDRMLTRMPDVTRLLDRMEKGGLVARSRENEDRRMVSTRITDAGRQLIEALEPGILALHQKLLGHLSDDQLHSVVDLLALIRNGP